MRSRLFQAVVGVGITLGTLNGGCLGASAKDDAQRGPEGTDPGSTDSPIDDGTNGEPASSGSDFENGSQTSSGRDASTSVGGAEGVGPTSSGTASATTDAGSGAEPELDPTTVGGAGGLGGAAGDSETTTTTEGGDDPDPIFDPYCDAAWPTTKGNPYPPSCVDPNHECDDAGYPARCLPRFEDGSCDYGYRETQSPFCIDGAWLCAPGLVAATDCQCFGPLPDGQVCGESGPEPRDG